MTLRRTRGGFGRGGKWRSPADPGPGPRAGLEDRAGASPAVQELAARLATQLPVGQAPRLLEYLTGVKRRGVRTPPGLPVRVARRQAQRTLSPALPAHTAPPRVSKN